MEIYAVTRPDESAARLASFRALITAHTDQVIIIGSLILGIWLIGSGLYHVLS